jgi:ophiobolin F synthase
MLLETNLVKDVCEALEPGEAIKEPKGFEKGWNLHHVHEPRGLFRMLLSLLQEESPLIPQFNLEPLILIFGRFFQIRDDYMNLQSTEHENQKSFCEDLDEKFSNPIVHLLAHKLEYESQITGIFRQRAFGFDHSSCLPQEVKMHILHLLNESGTFSATLDLLERLESEAEAEIEKAAKLESLTGEPNPLMRQLMVELSVKHL